MRHVPARPDAPRTVCERKGVVERKVGKEGERNREERKRERKCVCVCVLLPVILSALTPTSKPVRKQGMIKGDMKDFSQDAVENAEAVTPVGAHLVRRVTA